MEHDQTGVNSGVIHLLIITMRSVVEVTGVQFLGQISFLVDK